MEKLRLCAISLMLRCVLRRSMRSSIVTYASIHSLGVRLDTFFIVSERYLGEMHNCSLYQLTLRSVRKLFSTSNMNFVKIYSARVLCSLVRDCTLYITLLTS